MFVQILLCSWISRFFIFTKVNIVKIDENNEFDDFSGNRFSDKSFCDLDKKLQWASKFHKLKFFRILTVYIPDFLLLPLYYLLDKRVLNSATVRHFHYPSAVIFYDSESQYSARHIVNYCEDMFLKIKILPLDRAVQIIITIFTRT